MQNGRRLKCNQTSDNHRSTNRQQWTANPSKSATTYKYNCMKEDNEYKQYSGIQLQLQVILTILQINILKIAWMTESDSSWLSSILSTQRETLPEEVLSNTPSNLHNSLEYKEDATGKKLFGIRGICPSTLSECGSSVWTSYLWPVELLTSLKSAQHIDFAQQETAEHLFYNV